ncbi:MAG: MltA domain-containing protein [Rhodobacteraceae bacterium]|nr:MltA domain-containing protein [Paracoccaceae bacterium]
MCRPRRLSFADLDGWAGEDHAAALRVYGTTADLIPPAWPRPDGSDPRRFIETHFQPVEEDAESVLITGYYEPVIDGSLTPDERFTAPLYAPPDGLQQGSPWFSRSEIEEHGHLRGHELVWIESPLEAFLAQVQGSARLRLTDGTCLRLGYAGRNGHPYRSIGAELVQTGQIDAAEISVDTIRVWCWQNPGRVADLLRTNPSYVFFKRVDLAPDSGPIGTIGRPVTALRSIAVDPKAIPLGAMVWVECRGETPLRRLMTAQDTGSAIQGPGRVDIYCGAGPEAGSRAGRMRNSGRIVTLLPREMVDGAPG